jgi:peptidyl-prolyl cis-trans isomerase B (cyclophilin B)
MPHTTFTSASAFASLSGLLVALAATAADAQAPASASPTPRAPGSVVPPPTATPAQAQPALPPPVTVSEQRFRDLGREVRARGAINASLTRDLTALATALDTDLAAPTTSREMMLRLLPARAQVAVWLADDSAIDAAFSKLLELNPSSEIAALTWARELTAAARFEKAVEVLRSRQFTTRAIDAKIALGEALTGIHQFDDAQASLNTAPGGRSPEQQQAISKGTFRTQRLRELWEKELVAMGRDQDRGDLPVVEFVTANGPIAIELFEDQAPNTVASFIEHVEAGHYDGTTFHRALRGLGIQGGDPSTATGALGGKSTGGWTIPDEVDRADRRAPLAGRLVMAKQSPATGAPEQPTPNSAGSQFVVLFAPAEDLDGRYTVFGRVLEGMEYARMLGPTDGIVTARVVSKRAHEYKAVRLSEMQEGDYRMPRSKAEGGNSTQPATTPSAQPNAAPGTKPIINLGAGAGPTVNTPK